MTQSSASVALLLTPATLTPSSPATLTLFSPKVGELRWGRFGSKQIIFAYDGIVEWVIEGERL